MPSTAEHIAARTDQDLRARFVAAAEQAGIIDADRFVETNLGQLISTSIPDGEGTTSVTAVHAYANGVRNDLLKDDRLQPPGKNPGAVTDIHLAAAIAAINVVG